jgi:L-threonylcarbamoyladenylate synthase
VNLPLAAPSANPSGRVSPTTAKHVAHSLGTAVAAVLDGGPCARGQAVNRLGRQGDELARTKQFGRAGNARRVGIQDQGALAGHAFAATTLVAPRQGA